jgi:tetratricopeptide (TPR) repeat protein
MQAHTIRVLLLLVVFYAGQVAGSEPPVGLPAASPDVVRLHAEGLRQYGLKQYEKAIEVWQQELELLRDGPRKAVVLNDLALAYRELKDYEKAMQYNRQALAEDPNLGRTYFGIGANHTGMRNYGQARDAYLIAAALKYRPGLTYLHLGYAYLRMGEYNKAEAMLLTALKLGHDPGEEMGTL